MQVAPPFLPDAACVKRAPPSGRPPVLLPARPPARLCHAHAGRYDETRSTVHLDVLGKEYTFRMEGKEEGLEWFVALAHACGLA